MTQDLSQKVQTLPWDDSVVRWVFGLVCLIRDSMDFLLSVMEEARPELESSYHSLASEVLVWVDIYILTTSLVVVWPCYYGGDWKVLVIVNRNMVYFYCSTDVLPAFEYPAINHTGRNYSSKWYRLWNMEMNCMNIVIFPVERNTGWKTTVDR